MLKILIVAPSWVGDLVMAQSLFIALKRAQACQLTIIAPPWNQALLQLMPEVDAVLDLPFKHGELCIKARYLLGKSLRGQFDQAIVLPGSFKSALLPFFARIPKRTAWLGESRYGLLNDWRRLDKKIYPGMSLRYQALAYQPKKKIEDMIWPKLQTSEIELVRIRRQFLPNLSPNSIIAMCPGSEYGSSKRWPVEHYQALCEYLINEQYQIILLGSKSDQAVCQVINQGLNAKAIDLSGQTNILEAVYLIALSKGVVSNDSGLLHLAAALDKPLVGIYGSTAASIAPPLTKHAAIIENKQLNCRPCRKRQCPLEHHWCMGSLSPKLVYSALIKQISQCAS